jgi:hypothetical protein
MKQHHLGCFFEDNVLLTYEVKFNYFQVSMSIASSCN